MPESLHADLARASEQAGVSLNGFINEALANAVGRRPTAARATPSGKVGNPVAGASPSGCSSSTSSSSRPLAHS